MDVAGEQQLDVEHNLFKQRLDKNLKPVSTEAERHGKREPALILTLATLIGQVNCAENGRNGDRPVIKKGCWFFLAAGHQLDRRFPQTSSLFVTLSPWNLLLPW